MVRAQQIVDKIRSMNRRPICDLCLKEELNLATNQQAQVHTMAFGVTTEFTREKGECARCGKEKFVIFSN